MHGKVRCQALRVPCFKAVFCENNNNKRHHHHHLKKNEQYIFTHIKMHVSIWNTSTWQWGGRHPGEFNSHSDFGEDLSMTGHDLSPLPQLLRIKQITQIIKHWSSFLQYKNSSLVNIPGPVIPCSPGQEAVLLHMRVSRRAPLHNVP